MCWAKRVCRARGMLEAPNLLCNGVKRGGNGAFLVLHLSCTEREPQSSAPSSDVPSFHPQPCGRITPLPPASGREVEMKLGHCFSLFQIRKSFVTGGLGGCRGREGGGLSGKCHSVHTTCRTNVCFIVGPSKPAPHLQQACAPAKVPVMDLPILMNVNKQERNIK